MTRATRLRRKKAKIKSRNCSEMGSLGSLRTRTTKMMGLTLKMKPYRILYQKLVLLSIIRPKIAPFHKPNLNVNLKTTILVLMILSFGKWHWKMFNPLCRN